MKSLRMVFAAISFLLLAICVRNTLALNTQRVISGLTLPVLVTYAPGDSTRLFIVEQRSGSTGRIRVFHNGALRATPFLSVPSLATGNEQGLLGLAFHPQYQSNGYFYVYYTRGSDFTIVIARYHVSTVNPDSALPSSATTILTIPHPTNSNHNGGMLAFGPDGYLYLGTGDGGSGNDPPGNAQNDTVLLGKLLRIDVDSGSPYGIPPTNPYVGPDGRRDEIWAKGLRNPWRYSFDRQTGDLYIGDVGQDAWEEVDVQPAGAAGGRNYGWRCMEGFSCTGLTGCTCNSPTLTLPVSSYGHGLGCAIVGGYVYRGCAIPDLRGTYFFSDNCTSQIWTFRYVNGQIQDSLNRTADLAPGGGLSIASVSAFGEDYFGELYICDLSGGEVFKIVPDSVRDCNANGRNDACDIALGYSADVNQNGIPDECECVGTVVQDLCAFASGNLIVLRWTAGGNSAETFNVYRTTTWAAFPNGSWTNIATDLPFVSGPDAMSFADSTAISTNHSAFYVVTSVCP